MPQETGIQKKLERKHRKEQLAYFKEIVQKEGLTAALSRTLKYFKRRSGKKRGRFLPSAAELERQRSVNTQGWPKISVCVAVYNTEPAFLEEMVKSVVGQTYPNWELCLASTGDDPSIIRNIVTQCADARIVLKEFENKGISVNMNRAAELATGEYLAFLDHDDLLSPDALFEMAQHVLLTGAKFIYSDEALFVNDYMAPTAGHFKPDYSPQYLLNVNYMTHLAVVEKALFDELGGFDKACDGSQDHDLFLRILDKTQAAEHVPKVLYYWRQHAASTSTGVEAKPYVAQAAKRAIQAHLTRKGLQGQAADGLYPSTYKVNYEIAGTPKVSIIIPNYEHIDDLDRCITSIYNKTDYRNFEVLIVENNSKKEETFAYYQKVTETYPECKVLMYDGGTGFNFAKICNFGRRYASGQYVLFLNNDTEVINGEWLGEMLSLCQLDNVGVVGSMLYYPDDTVQHAGVIVGLGGYAGHSHKYAMRGRSGYMFRQACVQELSAVTGACMMVKSTVFDAVDGFDEGFSVAYNDVDLCLRIRQKNYWVLFTPYAELYHYESKTRGSDEEGEAKRRFEGEQQKMRERYGSGLLHDPFYSLWLTSDREDFTEADVMPVFEPAEPPVVPS